MHTLMGRLASTLVVGALVPVVHALPIGEGPDASSASTTKPSETIFVRGEHVITRPGQVIDGASLIVKNGRIVAIGKDLAKPDGAREISGTWVCAGFIDPWAAIGLGADVLSESSSTPATRTVDGLDVFEGDHLRRDALRAGVTAVRVQVGPTARVGGIGAVVRLVPGVRGPESIVQAESNVWMTIGLSQGGQPSFDSNGDFAGFGARPMDPFERVESVDRLVQMIQGGKNYLVQKNEYKHELEAWKKAIAEKEAELEKDAKKAKKDREKAEKDATEKGKKFEEKKYKEDKKPTAPRVDEDSEVLARVADGALPLIVHANRVSEIRALLSGSESLERMRWMLAGGSEATYLAAQLAERRVPVLVMPVPMGRGRPDEFEAHDLGLAGRLHRAGVDVLLGTGGVDPAATRDLPLLAGLAIGAGLDRQVAFEALTLGAARALDVADRIGSLETGKDADVLVLDGEPLVSTTRVRFVLAGGRVVVTPEDG